MATSWIGAVLILGAFASVECLQCYECMNCPSTLNETYLVTCNGTIPDINQTFPSANETLRVPRSTELDIDPDKACLCLGIECSCDEEGAILRAIRADNNATWECGSATYRRNGTDYFYKACVPNKVGDQEFCPYLNSTNLGVIISGDNTTQFTECSTCNTDKCNGPNDDGNGSSTIHSSVVFALLTVALLSVTK